MQPPKKEKEQITIVLNWIWLLYTVIYFSPNGYFFPENQNDWFLLQLTFLFCDCSLQFKSILLFFHKANAGS